MAHVSYPESFPLECISDLIGIVRGGMDEILARKAEVGIHVWNIQGFAQGMLLGNPDGPFGSSIEDEDQIGQKCNDLQAAMADVLADKTFAAGPVGIGGRINWVKLIGLVKELLPIILPLLV